MKQKLTRTTVSTSRCVNDATAVETKDRDLALLLSPGFVAALALLVINDFVLKQQFHGAVTGKLSDVTGLFACATLLAAFFPRRRMFCHLLVGAGFVFWKSAYSQPLIASWNNLFPFAVGRTIDYTDLVALLILPVSYLLSRSAIRISRWQPVKLFLIAVTVFAFTATSYRHATAYDNEYSFPISRRELIQRMHKLPSYPMAPESGDSDQFQVTFDDCVGEAKIKLSERDNQSVVRLEEIVYRCPSGGDKQQMLGFFEKNFISPLLTGQITKPNQVAYILGTAEDRSQANGQPSTSTSPGNPK